jgi:hypothetical protein
MEANRHFLLAEVKKAEDRASKSAHVNTLEVWRAARQLIAHYPLEPETAALQFADAALELGDFFIFLFWRKVALCTKVLRGKTP